MQAIDRAFAVLRALSGQSETRSLADISRDVALPKSTTLRLLTALVSHGAVDRVGDRYAIGSSLATLTSTGSMAGSLRELCRPALVELADAIGENASLAIADGDQVLYVDTVSAPGVVQVREWTGEHVPFHASAPGLAIMSTWPADRVATYAADGLSALTPSTISTQRELKTRLAATRRDGYASTYADFSVEVNGIAAPLVDSNGNTVGALAVFGPAFRFPSTYGEHRAADLIVEVTGEVARRLG